MLLSAAFICISWQSTFPWTCMSYCIADMTPWWWWWWWWTVFCIIGTWHCTYMVTCSLLYVAVFEVKFDSGGVGWTSRGQNVAVCPLISLKWVFFSPKFCICARRFFTGAAPGFQSWWSRLSGCQFTTATPTTPSPLIHPKSLDLHKSHGFYCWRLGGLDPSWPAATTDFSAIQKFSDSPLFRGHCSCIWRHGHPALLSRKCSKIATPWQFPYWH